MNISAIITTYNRYTLLKKALSSICNQSYRPKEIIVLDDGSTDNTKNIQKEFSNIRYIYKKNGGISRARNLAIKEAEHDWVAFLDDDDEWIREKLALQVRVHETHKNLKISFTQEKWIRDKKEIKVPKKYQNGGDDIFKKCLSHCFLAPSSALIKKDIFEDVGYFDESLEVCEDYDMWIKIASKYQIKVLDKPLIIKNAGHENQLSFKHWGMDRFRVQSLVKNLHELKDEKQKLLVKNEIIKKSTLLLKGARKHNRYEMIEKYENILKKYR